uniref:Serpin domain-containing protein n=1 Tax=Oryctolagus cuniculus TaxID=9986 RepID=A0A5F9D0Q7_RABIT
MQSSSSQRPLLLAVLCCLLWGPEATGARQSEESMPTQVHPTHSEPPVCQSIFNNIADIFLYLYKESAWISKSSNIVFSPLSVTAALATLFLGTKADAHSQIWNGLEFNLLGAEEHLVHACFQQLLRTFQHWDNELVAGSILFIDERLQPRAEFVQGVQQLSHTEAITVNLRDTHGARTQINSFLRRETKNEITDLVQELENNTSLALLTYISFHGKLRDEFHTELTVEENFHVDKRTTVRVPTVNRLGAFDLHRDTNFSSWVLAQHCLGDTVAYYVLPDEGKMEQLERGLTQEQLDGLLRPLDIRCLPGPGAAQELPELGRTSRGRGGATRSMHCAPWGRGSIPDLWAGVWEMALATEKAMILSLRAPPPAWTRPLPNVRAQRSDSNSSTGYGRTKEGFLVKAATECVVQAQMSLVGREEAQ